MFSRLGLLSLKTCFRIVFIRAKPIIIQGSWRSLPERNDLEHQALQIIAIKGNVGIPQRDLWRELGTNSREGSRVSIRLEKKNLIKREKEFIDGRWTYRIFIKHPVEIDSILGVPCVSCPDVSKCEAGSEVSPNSCVKLTQWLLSVSK